MKRIIYDLGAAKGENIDYYLLKSDLVVCVEANPENCKEIVNKYKEAINLGKIVVENCIIGPEHSQREKNFYIHKNNYLLSQYPEPNKNEIKDFNKIKVDYKNLNDVFNKHGIPHFIKIDLENYDIEVLEKILSEKIFFDYISFEIKKVETLDLFRKYFDMISFKIVDGHNIKYNYTNYKILTDLGKRKITFHPSSAGPYGDDLKGDWINLDTFREFLKFKLKYDGWYDVHFSKIDHPNTSISLKDLIKSEKINMFKVKMKRKLERVVNKFK